MSSARVQHELTTAESHRDKQEHTTGSRVERWGWGGAERVVSTNSVDSGQLFNYADADKRSLRELNLKGTYIRLASGFSSSSSSYSLAMRTRTTRKPQGSQILQHLSTAFHVTRVRAL